jgi:Ca2+-binding RTX toxin-like protein
MTTGTQGNDILTNDPAVDPETIDALGGDDVITVNRPDLSAYNSERLVTVNGGDGFDTLIVNANNYIFASNSGYDGFLRVREGNGINWYVSWTSIERLEINGGRFYNTDIVLGDEIDIIRMTPGFGGRISTNGGNDEIYFTGSGTSRVAVDGGSGDDIIDLSGLTYGATFGHEALGGEGNDILRGSRYVDLLDGGSGNDSLYLHGSAGFRQISRVDGHGAGRLRQRQYLLRIGSQPVRHRQRRRGHRHAGASGAPTARLL